MIFLFHERERERERDFLDCQCYGMLWIRDKWSGLILWGQNQDIYNITFFFFFLEFQSMASTPDIIVFYH